MLYSSTNTLVIKPMSEAATRKASVLKNAKQNKLSLSSRRFVTYILQLKLGVLPLPLEKCLLSLTFFWHDHFWWLSFQTANQTATNCLQVKLWSHNLRLKFPQEWNVTPPFKISALDSSHVLIGRIRKKPAKSSHNESKFSPVATARCVALKLT